MGCRLGLLGDRGEALFEVKEEAVNVGFGPFCVIEPLKHAAGGVFFSAVARVFELGGLNTFEVLGVGHGLGLGDKVEVGLEVVLEGCKNMGLDIGGGGRARPEEGGGEKAGGFRGKVAAPGEMLLMFVKEGQDGGGVFSFVVGVAREEGLHV